MNRRLVPLLALALISCTPAASENPTNGEAPTVSWKVPLSGATLAGKLPLSSCEATVTTKAAVAGVDFYVDGRWLNRDERAPYNCVLDTTQLADGEHQLEARAGDVNGKTGAAARTVTVRNGASGAADASGADASGASDGSHSKPSVSWIAPVEGATLSGTSLVNPCRVQASAADGIASVKFYLDAVLLNTEGIEPYDCELRPSDFQPGAHKLEARAVDAKGNSASAAINVKIVETSSSSRVLDVGAGYKYNTDGTADDVEINRAIRDAVDGDTVYVHKGTYDITKPIDLKSHITLKGDGPSTTTLRVPSTALATFNVEDASIIRCTNLSNVTIYGFKIDGNDGIWDHIGRGWENAIGIYAGGSNFTIHDFYITQINGDGIRTMPYPGYKYVDGASIYNIEVRRSGHDAIRAQAVRNWKISNINVEIYINYGIRFTDAVDCEVSWSTFYGLVGSGNAAIGLDGNSPGLHIKNCRFQNIKTSLSHGILSTSGTGIVTSVNNIFYRCEDGAITYSNPNSTSHHDFVIRRNIFDSNPFAINARMGAEITENIISNQTSYAIACVDSKYCTATGNNIHGGSTKTTSVVISGTLTGDPKYTNYSTQGFIPLASGAPLYSVMSSWTAAGYGFVAGP